MVLEGITIALLGITLGVKWFTTAHLNRLRGEIVAADNEVKKTEGRCKQLQAQRKEISGDIQELERGSQAADEECLDFEEDLFELNKRNAEIKEQIESRR